MVIPLQLIIGLGCYASFTYLNVAMLEQYGVYCTTMHVCHFGSKYYVSYRAQRLVVEHFRTLGLLLFGMAAGGWVLGPTH